ncbi:MAG: sugar ABC transporter permease [Chloroflexi bacterium]|nr:sugar ABC transporter permease [Chloroflexota bacterium]
MAYQAPSIPAPGRISRASGGPFGLSGAQRREIKRFVEALAYLSPALIIFAAFVFIPLAKSIRLSTFFTNPIGVPTVFAGLENYQRLIETPAFAYSLQRSVLFVLITVPTTLVFSMILALLGNLRLRRIDIFRMVFSCTIAVSGATAAVMFKYLFHPALGPLNYMLSLVGIPAVPWLISDQTALFAVAIATVWLQLGMNTVIMLAGMQGISDELYESAMIDGANAWHKFRSITIPLLSPTLFFLLIIDVLAAFQTFTQVNVMTHGGPMDSTNVLVFSIYREFYFNGQYGLAAAQAVVLFIIILLITIFQFGVVERKVHYT